MRNLLLLLSILCFLACKQTVPHYSRNLQESWQFQMDGDQRLYDAKVPGVVHLDLLENNLIENPFENNNELNQRWIEEENFQYSTYFILSEDDLIADHIELEFEGLDTYAEVYLNDSLIIESNNMFRSWKSEIKPLLKSDTNCLVVYFTSPINKNENRLKYYPYDLPSGNEGEDILVKVSPFTRKAAYHFGWDWGPRFVTSGIWKPVHLNFWNDARITNVVTRTTDLVKGYARIQTEVEIECSTHGLYELTIGEKRAEIELYPGTNSIFQGFDVENPELWWCNGEGEAHLYSEKVVLKNGSRLLDSCTNRFGIRTIELVQEEDSIGTSFYFLLNGKPVFMKGANYIPQDIFLPRVKDEQYEALITSAQEAGMNMLRVWGGGVYEKDIFYDLCDEKGILVWQDFMFAGSMYPVDSLFLQNVEKEAEDNLKRLSSHPCIALWCGNNEIDVAWKNWGWQKQYGYSVEDSIELWNGYESLFKELLPKQVKKWSPMTPFVHTSPLRNWGTPENFNHSSMHYWGVWHGKEPFESFEKNVGRFMVEFGFQSFPDIETLARAISEDQLTLESDVMRNRQKSYIGNGLITQHIEQYYPSPTSFEEFVELSQEVQAKGLDMAIKAHMKSQPHCMGTLFWQLNDCWPGPSWSVIDYYGRKKKAYEVVKKNFNQVQDQ